MPSGRRRFLRTLPVAAVGLAGCNGLLQDERGDEQNATSSARGRSPVYEPTTPVEGEGTGTVTERPEYAVQTPVTVIVRNYTDETWTVDLTLEIDPPSEPRREVLDGSHEAPPGETVRVDEFEQNGKYHFTVETDDRRFEDWVYISMRDLADCNAVSVGPALHDSSIRLGGEKEQAGCPPVTVTPDSSEGAGGT